MYADENNIAFTLYVDDITISGKVNNVLSAMSFIIKKFKNMDLVYEVKKLELCQQMYRKNNTGLNTNRKLNFTNKN